MKKSAYNQERDKFYASVIEHINKSKIPYLLGGTYAVREYTGIKRETKDMDFFCKSSDYPRILEYMRKQGFETEVEDERFVAKIKQDSFYVDLIMGSFNSSAFVDDTWFDNAQTKVFLGQKTKIISPEDLIWTKIYVTVKYAADINHIILKQGKTIDWKRLLTRMEQHWEVLFSHLLSFRFIYPSERDIVPRWLMQEMLSRLQYQLKTPPPKKKICRGRLFSVFEDNEYAIDFKEWGFEDSFTFH